MELFVLISQLDLAVYATQCSFGYSTQVFELWNIAWIHFPLETTISPKEVIINGSDDEARRCFTCNTTQQEIYWGVDGEYHTAEEVYLYEDQIVGTFCSNFTSNTTVTCFGESSALNNSVSENDTGQVTFIDEG